MNLKKMKLCNPGVARITLRLMCLLLLVCNWNALSAQDRTRPNIIIIFPDDLGYGDIGINGQPNIRTPNIDRLALQGRRMTNFYSGSPACTASRYALLTGKYPAYSGFDWVLYPDSERGLHPREKSLAQELKQLGYKTAIYGKWHLGSTRPEYLPIQHGFDDYFGLPYSNDMQPPKWPNLPLMEKNDTIAFNPDQAELTKLYTEKAKQFIEANKDNPFFLYLPYAMPHVPLYASEQFKGKSKRGSYGDVVEEIDWAVGEIFNELVRNGLEQNTLIWFASDNGPWIIKKEEGGSAGLFRDGKGSTWEGGMRVPSIVYWGGKIKPGSINQEPASTLDIFSSIISIAGGVADSNMVQGRDITKFILDAGRDVPVQPLFFYGNDNTVFAVRKGKWKLHIRTFSQLGIDYFSGKVPLLFDLETDPSERYELSDQYPDIVKDLELEIDQQNVRAIGASFYD